MNPGYDRLDHPGFSRSVSYDCMFCHNAYPEASPAHGEPGAEPVFPGALPAGSIVGDATVPAESTCSLPVPRAQSRKRSAKPS